jgi:hypothetical protein
MLDEVPLGLYSSKWFKTLFKEVNVLEQLFEPSWFDAAFADVAFLAHGNEPTIQMAKRKDWVDI